MTPPHGSAGARLSAICAGVFMVYLDSTVVSVALPDVQTDLGVDLSDLQWVFDGYVLAFACFLLTAGALGDVFGRRRTFLVALAGFVLASALCAVSGGLALLLVARAVQGVFGAGMITVSLALIRQLYTDDRERARAVAIWAGVGGVALAAGPILGGLLVDAASWRSVFWINVPIGAVAFVALRVLLPQTDDRTPDAGRTRASRLDPVGQTLFVAGAGLLTYAMIHAGSVGWSAPSVVVLLVVAAVLLAGFALWLRQAAVPLVPPSLLRRRAVLVACAVNFLAFFGLFGLVFLLTLFLQQVGQLTPVQTGLRLFALTLSIMLFSLAAPAIADRIGRTVAIVLGSCVLAVGFLGMLGFDGGGFATYWWPLVLVGAGISLIGAPATVQLLEAVPAAQAGVASGASQTCRQIGAVFGVALSGSIVQQGLRARLPDAMAGDPVLRASLPAGVRSAVARAIGQGQFGRLDLLPPAARGRVLRITGDLAADGLHLTMIVAAAGAVVAALVTAGLSTRRASLPRRADTLVE